MTEFKNLRVWHQSRELLKMVSEATARMSGEGDLKSQMRRAAISIAANIAEGSRPGSDREFVRSLRFADGSASELQAQAMIAGDCGCLTRTSADAIAGQAQIVGRMLNGLLAYLTASG